MPPGQKKSKPTVSAAVQLDANKPIPFEFGGNAFISVDGLKYVPFLSTSDNFFQTLLEARLLSVTQDACIRTKKDYSIGEGLFIAGVDDIKKADPNLDKWMRSVNNKYESLNKICDKAFGNHYTFGNCFLEVVRGTVGGKKFVKVYLHNTLECRLGNPNKDDICTTVIKSKKFKDKGIWRGNGSSIEIPIYNPSNEKKSWMKDGAVERTMIHIKNEMEGYDYYGMPSNVSGLPQQVYEYEMVRYNLDNLENNMNPGGLVVLEGNISQPEATTLGKNLIRQHTGKGKRGRWVVAASENGIANSKIEQFDTNQEGSFIEMDKHNMQKIIFANAWDALLAGLQDAGTMGKGNAYILSLFRLKYQTVIKPVQAFMIDNLVKPLLQIHDDWVGTKWSGHEFNFMTNTPVSILDSDKTLESWTVDEIRKEAGLPEFGDARGKMLYGELIKKGSNVPSQ